MNKLPWDWRKAYNEADKWFNKDIGMTVEERSEIAADLARLKPELFPSSRSFPTHCPFTAVSLKESLLAFAVPVTTPAVSSSCGLYDYVVRLRAFSRA
jgi:hypothetical protein